MTCDRRDFRIINDFARSTGWLHTFMPDGALYGLVLFAVVLLYGWWKFRRSGAVVAFSRVYVGVHYPVDVIAGLDMAKGVVERGGQ